MLGGIKISSCFNDFDAINNILSRFNIDNIILHNGDTQGMHVVYLCGLSIIGMFLISLISIYGYLMASKSSPFRNYKWILIPLPFSFIILASIFQQSFGIHNEGYSYIFSFVFAFGLTYLLILLMNKVPMPFKLFAVLIAVWPIFLNSLRITSYWIPAGLRQTI